MRFHRSTEGLFPATMPYGSGRPRRPARWLFKTDPYNSDTDGDGKSDGQEIAAGFSPASAATSTLENVSAWSFRPSVSSGIFPVSCWTASRFLRIAQDADPGGGIQGSEQEPGAWSKSAVVDAGGWGSMPGIRLA